MVYIRSRKFCCCLPVRLGTFVLTIFAMGVCGLAAGAGWYEIINRGKVLARNDLITLYAQTVVYTVGALVSFFGLVGTIIKRRAFVSLYSRALAFHLVFHFVTGAIHLYLLFKNTQASEIQNCVNKANSTINTDPNKVTQEVCEKAFAFARGLAIALFVIICLIELYACIIASNYAAQLEEEDAAKAPKYALGQMEPLHPYGGGHYAFTGSNAAIGNQSHA